MRGTLSLLVGRATDAPMASERAGKLKRLVRKAMRQIIKVNRGDAGVQPLSAFLALRDVALTLESLFAQHVYEQYFGIWIQIRQTMGFYAESGDFDAAAFEQTWCALDHLDEALG